MILERGKSYPLALPDHDAVYAHFLVKGGSVLALRVNGMTGEEERALRYGVLKAGLLQSGPALLWLFEFSDENGRPIFTFDAPFDARKIPADQLDLPSTDSGTESRLLVQIHAVDELNILRGLRGVSLPPALTRRFLSAVMDQLVFPEAGQHAHHRWLRREPGEWAKTTSMALCG